MIFILRKISFIALWAWLRRNWRPKFGPSSKGLQKLLTCHYILQIRQGFQRMLFISWIDTLYWNPKAFWGAALNVYEGPNLWVRIIFQTCFKSCWSLRYPVSLYLFYCTWCYENWKLKVPYAQCTLSNLLPMIWQIVYWANCNNYKPYQFCS